jgi:hypothetical protein
VTKEELGYTEEERPLYGARCRDCAHLIPRGGRHCELLGYGRGDDVIPVLGLCREWKDQRTGVSQTEPAESLDGQAELGF